MKKIIQINNQSIAEELGIQKNDYLVSMNDKSLLDIFDYRYEMQNEIVRCMIKKRNGKFVEYEIEKEDWEDLGLVFECDLMDDLKSCQNRCVFCFIDQLPIGMRDSLYFKDDDYRLSFLHGNYITLTNTSEEEINRIIKYRFSPMNISIHATNPAIRIRMMKNPTAGNIMEQISKLYEAKISMNFQIVLCKTINDGDILTKTIEDCSKFMPVAQSLSVVPVGLTKFRDHLDYLPLFSLSDKKNIIAQITNLQEKYLKQRGSRFVYLADEFYLHADCDIPLPPLSAYEELHQYENGVGMMSLFLNDLEKAMETIRFRNTKKTIALAAGVLFANYCIRHDIPKRIKKLTNLSIDFYPVVNHFFGKDIQVSGLLCGVDLVRTLKNQSYDYLLLSEDCFKKGENLFLDDQTIEQVEEQLNTTIIKSPKNPCEMMKMLKKILE